jgi:hypothetical protein
VAGGGPEWLPLEKAFRCYADPGAREEYISAKVAEAEASRLWRGLPSYGDDVRGWRDAEPERHRVSHLQGRARAQVRRAWKKLRLSFFKRLFAGELICRAREGYPLGPWRDVPADAWKVLQVESWKAGKLKAAGTDYRLFSTEVAASPSPQAAVVEPGARLTTGAHAASTGDMPDKRKAFSQAEVQRWYTQEWVPQHSADGKPPSRDEDLRAARALFPGASRDFLRQRRQECAPTEWKGRGRRRTTKEPS